MQLDLTTPALLFPAVAILLLGYINRYISTASVIRTFKKDLDSGYEHIDLVKQLTILQKRINLSRDMIAVAAVSLLLACLSMLFIFIDYRAAGEIVFSLALASMIVSLALALYETSLSNKSLSIEIQDAFEKEKAKN